MKEETYKITLTNSEKQQLRFWCLKTERDLPIQLYNWLLKAESKEDLELRKSCKLIISDLGSSIDQYNWIVNDLIPQHILINSDYPALESDPS